jgi:dTDP-glucose 4,6-dehydratase
MGEPVRILDVAERMIAKSGREIGIVITGLRHGEKLHEELVGLGENDERPIHPKISHTGVPPLSPAELADHSWGSGNARPPKKRLHDKDNVSARLLPAGTDPAGVPPL